MILYGERAARRRRRRALLALADALELAGHDGRRPDRHPRRRQRPRPARGRACCPNGRARPRRRAPLGGAASTRPAIAAALAARRARPPLYLLGVDPLRDLPDRAAWERALEHATHGDRPRGVPHRRRPRARRPSSSPPSPPPRRRARSPTPTVACSGCARRSPARARSAPEWSVLAELARAWARAARPLRSGAAASAALFDGRPVLRRPRRSRSSPATGVRWQERPQAAALPRRRAGPAAARPRAAPAPRERAPAPRRYRSIWAAPEVEASPALHFLIARQRVELRPPTPAPGRRPRRAGARRDEPARGRGRVALRDAVPAGRRSSSAGWPRSGADALRGRPSRSSPPRARRSRRRDRSRRRSRDARGRRLLRGVVDPDHQGARDLRRRAGDPAARASSTSASCSAASRAATGPTASAPTGSLQPLAEIVKFATKEELAAGRPRSAALSRSRR